MFILRGVYCLILQKLLDMFAENLKQATSFTLHRAFPSNGNHTELSEPANEQAPSPADKEAELETLHTTRDDILRLQQISKDVVSTKNNRKRGKETVGELFICTYIDPIMVRNDMQDSCKQSKKGTIF